MGRQVFKFSKVVFVILVGLFNCVVHAETTAQSMIDQLKPKPLTRSLRNLTVESTGNASGDAQQQSKPENSSSPTAVARPSVSLSILFAFDSAQIQPESYDTLSNLALALSSPELRQYRFLIEGHTDAKGAADYNLKLSEKRSLAVKELLAGKGVEPDRLQAIGKGSTEPANKHDPRAPENRRVKIINLD